MPPALEIKTLDSTGFGPIEARTYRTLLATPASSAAELASQLGVSLVDADHALQTLEAKGLAGRLPGAGQQFRATPPNDAFRPLIRRRRAELRALQAEVGHLVNAYRPMLPADGAERVELLTGNAHRHAARLLERAAVEVCALVITATPPATNRQLRVPPGVSVRVVYPRAVLSTPDGRSRVTATERAGARVRVTDRPPIALVAIDRSIGLVPVQIGDTDGALVVHAGGLQDALFATFDRTWAVAEPLSDNPDGESGAPGPEDLKLLGLLLDGLTDEAIAGKLDVGARTVQRRVRDLIEMAGVRTRLQLIWQATRNGWI